MADETQTALEQRLDWCEAQLALVRKRMFSMGILIALLTVLLIWRTKMPGDLVRSGGAARFSSVEVLDEHGRRTVLDGASVELGDDEDKTWIGAPDAGSGAGFRISGSGRSLTLGVDGLRLGHGNDSIEISDGLMSFYRSREIRPGTNGIEAEASIGPGFVSVRDLGGDVVVNARKEDFGVQLMPR